MAKKTIVIRTDDIDGGEGARTVTFALDGKSYEIDLSDANIARLTEALEPFVAKARRVGAPRRTRRGGASGPSESARIRAWAREQGLEVPDRGRVPSDIVEKYNAAN